MSYHYLPDVSFADVCFEASSPTFKGLLKECGKAATNAMVRDPSKIRLTKTKKIRVEAPSEGELVRKFIDELVFWKDAEQLLFNGYALKTTKTKTGWVVTGTLKGEKINPRRHDMAVDVKAATLHLFAIEKTAKGWRARVVLDV